MQNGNAADWFVDRNVREGRGEKTAFIEGARRLSYGDLAAQSDRIPHMLAKLGLRREDRAVMLMHDVIEFPVVFWGAIKAGVQPVPLNTLLTQDQYRYILTDARARAVFVSAAMLDVVAPVLDDLPDLAAVVVVGGETDRFEQFDALLAAAEPGRMVAASSDECAFWLYSSGSTGNPKGVRHVHGALQATAETYGAQVLGIEEGDVILSAAKLFFAYGLGNGMTFPMSVGATAVLFPGRPTPDAMFDVMEAEAPTIFCGVPTLFAAMNAANSDRRRTIENLRICISAGEALPADVGHRWKALTQADILDGVGSTEMLHIFLSNTRETLEYGASGVAVPGYDLRLVDEDGDEVGVDEVGELLVRGDSAADCYWNQRAKSRKTFEGEWTRTGDKYTRRADGRYVYCGRTDDMFKVSGIWLSPFEVEQALVAHPAVLEAAVVAARDDQGLEKPKAFVVLNEGVSAEGLDEALKTHVKTEVGLHKYPRWVSIVDELPKTATGKIQRFKLRG